MPDAREKMAARAWKLALTQAARDYGAKGKKESVFAIEVGAALTNAYEEADAVAFVTGAEWAEKYRRLVERQAVKKKGKKR